MTFAPDEWSDVIRTAGAYLHLSQEQQAEEIGVDIQTIRFWEYGIANPSNRSIERIAEVMKEWFGRQWVSAIRRLWEKGLRLPPNRQAARWLIVVGDRQGIDFKIHRYGFESNREAAVEGARFIAEETGASHVILRDRIFNNEHRYVIKNGDLIPDEERARK